MKMPMHRIGIALPCALLALTLIAVTARAGGGGQRIPVRPPTSPGTPALVAAGTNAEALARAALNKAPSGDDAASNPTVAEPGANPPVDVDGNYLIGPVYVRAREIAVNTNVPQGRIESFYMDSADSKYFPGIAIAGRPAVDTNNPNTLVLQTRPAPYRRLVIVYVPSEYVAGTQLPFLIVHDGPRSTNALDHVVPVVNNMIAGHRLPVMAVILIQNGGNDAQGSERGLEYDTMSDKFAEYIENEVLPLVEKNCGVTLTRDPDARAVMGNSSGGAAALEMAWYHPEWYHRVITYSGTFVNQQWPFNPETPGGAWDFHEKLIPQSDPKPLRIWMEVGDTDLYNPNLLRDNMHDWVVANDQMAKVLRAKGYHYQFVYALNAGHVSAPVRDQTLPEALEWAWAGYPH